MTALDATAANILIADDQPEVLEALRLFLKGEGLIPHVVSSPAALLEALRDRHFDMVLMDLNYARDTTSGQEGLDLLSRIREFDSTLPVIVMTGWGSVELAVEAMRRGVQDFIQKPWENDRLLQVLRKHIKQGQALRRTQYLEAETKVLARSIRAATDFHDLARRVVEHLRHTLQNRSVTFFTRASVDRAFWETVHSGPHEGDGGKLRFEADSRFLSHMDGVFDPCARDIPAAEKTRLQNSGCSLIVPIRLNNELSAFIGLGEKAAGVPFDQEDFAFLGRVVEQIGAGIEDLRLRGQERDYQEAREIQQGLLPKRFPQISHHEISGAWQPANVVGGDYFDALKFSESRVGLCIADVVGKGMPAALLMSNLQAAVRAFAHESMLPRELCAEVNRVLCSNIAANKFITFFYCLYDADKRQLIHANAGHNAPILVRRDGSHARLSAGGAVLGVFPDWTYDQSEVAFGPGDRIVLFTDGVTEALNAGGEEFGEKRLLDLTIVCRHLRARELQKRIMDSLIDYCGGAFQDDATLIILSAE